MIYVFVYVLVKLEYQFDESMYMWESVLFMQGIQNICIFVFIVVLINNYFICLLIEKNVLYVCLVLFVYKGKESFLKGNGQFWSLY